MDLCGVVLHALEMRTMKMRTMTLIAFTNPPIKVKERPQELPIPSSQLPTKYSMPDCHGCSQSSENLHNWIHHQYCTPPYTDCFSGKKHTDNRQCSTSKCSCESFVFNTYNPICSWPLSDNFALLGQSDSMGLICGENTILWS